MRPEPIREICAAGVAPASDRQSSAGPAALGLTANATRLTLNTGFGAI